MSKTFSEMHGEVVGSTFSEIMSRYGFKNKNQLVDTLRLLDKISNGVINNPISEVSQARKNGEDVSKILTPGDEYRKKFGECFTPVSIIDEMLDKLPKKVWSNPNLKWLDNSVGGGNFMVEVKNRLMEGLKRKIVDEAEREKHIIENMLFFVDIQAKNIYFTMQRLGGMEDYSYNCYVGSALDNDFDYWGCESFDIVVGNPPYNGGIDLKFLKQFIQDLNVKHIVLIHPSTYLIDRKRSKKYETVKELLDGKLKSVTLFNGNPVFGIGLFVPCVIIDYDRDYNGECVVNYFGEEFTSDVWNITKFGKAWENIVKQFMAKMERECYSGNNVWDKRISQEQKVSKNKHYCQFAAIIGHTIQMVSNNSRKGSNKMVKDDFYTMVMKDSDNNKGIRKDNRKISNGNTPMPTYEFSTEKERDNFITFSKTYFARFCLALTKNNQIIVRGEMSLIPWLDFTQEWTDEKLFKHFKIDKKTQEYIYSFLPDYYGLGKPNA